jgi:hypothetical protein
MKKNKKREEIRLKIVGYLECSAGHTTLLGPKNKLHLTVYANWKTNQANRRAAKKSWNQKLLENEPKLFEKKVSSMKDLCASVVKWQLEGEEKTAD